MFTIEKTKDQLVKGFTCVCGQRLTTTLHRITCPHCQQVYTTPAQGDAVGLHLTRGEHAGRQ